MTRNYKPGKAPNRYHGSGTTN